MSNEDSQPHSIDARPNRVLQSKAHHLQKQAPIGKVNHKLAIDILTKQGALNDIKFQLHHQLNQSAAQTTQINSPQMLA